MTVRLPTADEPAVLIQGDCLEVMRQIPDGTFDAVITSPPYNLGTTTGGGFPTSKGKWERASAAGGLSAGYGAHADAMPHEEYVAWQHKCLREMWRLLTDAGAIFYNHKPRVLAGRLVTPFEYNPGLPVRQVVIWARAGGINFAPTHYCPTHEWVMVLAKDAFRLKSKGASGVGDVWNIPQEANPGHPAPYPVELPRRILGTINARRVLDPFAGSGTTGVACVATGAQFLGIELEPAFADLARRKINEALGVGGLFAPARPTAAELFT